jgi:alpha-glucoside transport system permease protein
MAIVEDTGAEGTGTGTGERAPTGDPQAKRAAKSDVEEVIEKGRTITVGFVVRLVVIAGIVAFLGFYVGPGEMAETLLKVAIAVALSALLFIAANRLFDLAYPNWPLFNALTGVAVGFVLFVVLDNNGVLRTPINEPTEVLGMGPWDLNPWLWGLLGGAALGVVMFLLSAPRDRAARMPLAVLGFGGFGVVLSLSVNEAHQPSIDWAKLAICAAIGAVVFGGIGLRKGVAHAERALLTGIGVGWLVGAWGGAEIGAGNVAETMIATVVPAVLIGARVGFAAEANSITRRRVDQRSRSWIFLVPALAFVIGGLVIPLIRTVYLSFRSANSEESVGLDNYFGSPNGVFRSKNSVNFDNWTDVFTSRLLWIALGLILLGVLGGIIAGRRTRQPFEKSPGSIIPIGAGFFVLAIAILASVRGTLFNNVWWVIVVTTLATAIGLAVAVLAERSKGENFAKSLIFLPMAISFVGAGIIWRFVYQAREIDQNQTGVLNAFWIWLGKTSHSTGRTAIVVIVLAIIGLLLILLVKRGVDMRSGVLAGSAIGLLILDAYLIYRFIGPGLGGFETLDDGTVRAKPVLFVQEPPFNNMWLMVVLIWIQTGFAMVILSAAIKAVPTELIEAATVDGATESQIFWRVTLPQIAATVGVVITTLFVTVMKVFDIVKVMTGGNFGTEVIANEMFTRAFGQSNFGLGSALAVVLTLAVLPVMYINIRRMRQARV